MLTAETYNQQIHRLFKVAYSIRCNTNSTTDELFQAAEIIDDALSLTTEMEVQTNTTTTLHEIIVDRIRCYIERIATYARLLKNTYGTPNFNKLSAQQERYCNQYLRAYSHIKHEEVQQSQHQLTILAYQSLAASYFRRGGMGKDKLLCKQATSYLDKAMELTKDDKHYSVLLANKQQILQATG